MSTRRKILDAATSIMEEDNGQHLTVRAVAARAGVGMGTLRHHFPTQRVLLDAVLASMYESAMPDDRIHDTTLPARQRLIDNLGRLVAAIGVGDEARARWGDIFQNYISPDAPDDVRCHLRRVLTNRQHAVSKRGSRYSSSREHSRKATTWLEHTSCSAS